MKKILLLLLLATFSIQAQTLQNPTYGNVKLKNNTTDNSATKVNVQSTDGTINTISKSDLVNVVEVNDVPTLPLVGEVGKIYVVKNVNKIYRWNGTFYQELAGTDISGKINVSEKGVTVATLGSDGKVLNNQIPALAISETFPVSSQDQMLALSQADQGDVAIRSDISKSFILRVLPSSVLANWSELLTPTGAVTSVNGQVGVVTLSKSDVGLSNVDNTSDANKPISTAQQTALNLKENAFTKNTAFNKNFGTTAGTVVEGGTLGSNAYSSTAYLPIMDGYRTSFDFNSKLTSGFYNSDATNVNNPSGQGYSQLIVAKGVDTGLQIAGGFNTDDLHFRGWANSGTYFTPWRKIWHDGNFNPGNYLPISGGTLTGDLKVPRFFNTILTNSLASRNSFNSFNANDVVLLQGWVSADFGGIGTEDRVVLGSGFSGKAIIGGHSNALTAWADLIINPDQNSGNVGIGTATPTARLDVNGNIKAIEGKFSSSVTATSFNGSATLTGTPTAPTATAGTNTTQIATTAFVGGGLATKENAFTKNTAFNKNFGTTVGTVVEGGTLGSNAYSSTAYLPLTGGALTGTPTAPTAPAGTNTTQIATTAFVLANSSARPYKVYTALISQSGASAPTATVLENTLDGSITWSRNSVGVYLGTLANGFSSTLSKVRIFISGGEPSQNTTGFYNALPNNIDSVQVNTRNTSGSLADSLMSTGATIEIRVYL